jgi:hypothetical protein
MTLVKWIHLRQLTPLGDLIARLEQGGLGGPAPARQPTPAMPRPMASRPTPPPTPPARSRAVPSPPPTAAPAASSSSAPPQAARAPAPAPGASGDPKAALLAAIREQNRMFYGMVVAQAQKVSIEDDTIVFTFAAVHRHLRTQLEGKRAWIEQLAEAAAGRHLSVVGHELSPVAQAEDRPQGDPRRADLVARAKAEPTVQAVLDVFGGEIENIEEIE